MVAILKQNASANARILAPNSILYIRQNVHQGEANEVLAAGAIVGIAVGVTAAAVAALAAGLLLVRRRRNRHREQQQQQQQHERDAAAMQSPKVMPVAVQLASPPQSPVRRIPLQKAFSSPMPSRLIGSSSSTAALVLDLAAIAKHTSAGSSTNLGDTARSGSAGNAPWSGHTAGASAHSWGSGPQQPHTHQHPQPRMSLNSNSGSEGALVKELLEDAEGQLEQRQPEVQVAAVLQALPAALRQWVVRPEELTFCRLPNGRLHELGAGARWVLAFVLRPSRGLFPKISSW